MKPPPVILRGGSNGFQWKAARLPPGVAGPGLSKPAATDDKVFFENALAAGDVVTGMEALNIAKKGCQYIVFSS